MVSTEGIIGRSGYNGKGRSGIDNNSFNGEVILMDLDEEHVNHIVHLFLYRGDEGKI